MDKLKDLIPMLESNDLEATIDFYKTKLGFSIQGTHHSNERMTWVSLRKDDVIIMFSVRFYSEEHPETIFTGSLYLYPDNIESLWESLKDQCQVDWPLQDFNYGMKEFAIKDNNGYRLIFGQEID